ncbi:hypothetical protein C0Q70_04007 [Pomacea canaliculata]|uniref:ATP-grasp domain-containing protein n=1 Tax=Pomacea canaliculata TaxID=400727 RepID=A0A2T7PUA7_POMCA|nr:hypothetical protein C0Q70_04007 [Pomacea canaliculata]
MSQQDVQALTSPGVCLIILSRWTTVVDVIPAREVLQWRLRQCIRAAVNREDLIEQDLDGENDLIGDGGIIRVGQDLNMEDEPDLEEMNGMTKNLRSQGITSLSTITIIPILTDGIGVDFIQPHLQRFLGSDAMEGHEKVQVRLYHSLEPRSVAVHSTCDINAIITSILELAPLLQFGDGILVEAFHTTFSPLTTSTVGKHGRQFEDQNFVFRVRAVVSRTLQDEALMTQSVCIISDNFGPVDDTATIPMSLELTLRKWGIYDATQQHDIRYAIKRHSENLLQMLIQQEKTMTAEADVGTQTEVIGIDYVLTQVNDVITPVVLEVKVQGCLRLSCMYEALNPEVKGQAAREMLQTMTGRAHVAQLRGKMVLVVGAAGYSKRHLWKEAAAVGVKVVLVDSNPNHMAKKLVEKFLHHDITDHTRDIEHAEVIIARVKSEVGQVDGCLTFWEDCVPLASLVAEGLNLPHTPPCTAAMAAKSKVSTMKVLMAEGGYSSQRIPARVYASHVVRISHPDDLEQAIKEVPLPAVLKMEHGAGSVGIRHVKTYHEALEHVHFVQETLCSGEHGYTLTGPRHSNILLLMKTLRGTEHNVDLVFFEGQPMAAFVSDRGPARLPLFSQTACAMPSLLSQEQQQQLVTAAITCCQALGLHTGVFNVDMMMSPQGPRLIEVNARMGGRYLRDWIRLIFRVDMVHLALAAACGIRPVVNNSMLSGYPSAAAREDRGQLIGISLYSSHHGTALATTATPELLRHLHERGDIIFTQMYEDAESRGNVMEKLFANLAVRAPTIKEARAKLTRICVSLGLETEESMVEILQNFEQY